MFLFNSLDNSGDVNSALRFASRRTGVDMGYLKTTARRESNLNPQAKAGSSSATGLFQFIEKTWLSVLKEAGPRHGYGALADKIQPSASGGYRVSDAQARSEILKLREDPKAAALMAGEFTAKNAETLQVSLGRPASEGELYAAHFLGARGAVELVRLTETAPNTPAAERFPAAASANRSIFYKPGGTPRTAREVYANLVSGYDATPAIPDKATYLAVRPGRAGNDQAFHGLYRTDNTGLGPISRSVTSFWGGFGAVSDAFGFSGAPAVTAAGDIDAASDIVIETSVPQRENDQAAGLTSDNIDRRPAGQSRVRGYGRFADDPSRPVR